MSSVLVDSSVWIDYFRNGKNVDIPYFEEIIDNNQVCINDLILAELLPLLKVQKQNDLIDILLSIKNIPLVINWEQIIDFQFKNVKNGINNIGIPDLIIQQNVIDNSLTLYSLDKHFKLMNKLYKYEII
jgi:predicted nucleic acid-binding protein